eukprot:GHVH01012147.1.p1 GENE.GHVH01012147.1~~GHVH01012147.1.p1  ORF type:complete len:764 (+),score=83.85 GHVH01012147.1:157-2448(+)
MVERLGKSSYCGGTPISRLKNKLRKSIYVPPESVKKLQVTWNLKFTNVRKEQLYWRSVLRSQNSSFSAVIFSILFLFCMVRFLSGLIDNSEIVQLTGIADRPLNCLNCVDGLCSLPVNITYEAIELPRSLDSAYRVIPNYNISPMQASTWESDNICPDDEKYQYALEWIAGKNSSDPWMTQEIKRIQQSHGCDLLMTGVLDNRSVYNEDIIIIGIFLIILLMQVVRAIWDHRTGSSNHYNPWDSGFSYVEREQDKIRLRTRDNIQKLIQADQRHYFDISDSHASLEDDRSERIIIIQHNIKIFLCYTAYTVSVFMSTFSLRGSTRFSGGLLVNEECPDGEFDLNSASLYTKGVNTGEFDSIFTWSHHGFKYIMAISAIHFSGAVRFVTLLPISLLFAAISICVLLSFRMNAELRIALAVIPFMHVLFLIVVYQVEYTERLMWDIQRTMHKTTISQRKVCEDMLPKTALKAILKDSLDLAYRNDHVTFLFSDIVGFTNFSDKVDAGQVLRLLQSLFVHFDFMVSYYGLFKVCTIGDAYVTITQPTNALGRGKRNVTLEDIAGFVNILQFGYTMLKRVTDVKQTLKISSKSAEGSNNNGAAEMSGLAIRIGLHHGTCVGGIIGSGRIRYDIWGVDVLIGECMEQNGVPMELHVSQPWKTFYGQYPVTAILATMTIEDAMDYPMSKIGFQYNKESKLNIDKPNKDSPSQSKLNHESYKDDDEEVTIKGYLLTPSWEGMIEEQLKELNRATSESGDFASEETDEPIN